MGIISERHIFLVYYEYYYIQQMIFSYPRIKLCKFFGDEKRQKKSEEYYECKCIKKLYFYYLLSVLLESCYFDTRKLTGVIFSTCPNKMQFVYDFLSDHDYIYCIESDNYILEDVMSENNDFIQKIMHDSNFSDIKNVISNNLLWLKVSIVVIMSGNETVFIDYIDILKNQATVETENKLIEIFTRALFKYCNTFSENINDKNSAELREKVKKYFVELLNNKQESIYVNSFSKNNIAPF